MKGITPVIATILLLLMTVAAAGAAYLWINKLQTMMSEGATASWEVDQKKRNTRYAIDSMWNDTGGSLFVAVRNSGEYDIPANDFFQTGLYVNSQRYTLDTLAVCGTPVLGHCCATDIGDFYANTIRTFNCSGAYTGACDPNCPKITLKVQPPYGSLDTASHQYQVEG